MRFRRIAFIFYYVLSGKFRLIPLLLRRGKGEIEIVKIN